MLITEKLDEFIEKQKERANSFIQDPKYENLMLWIETEQDFFIDDCNALIQHYKPTEKELLLRLSQFVEENLS